MNDLWAIYDSIDADTVDRYVKERRQEGLHLDFKVLGDDRTFQRDDRKNLAIAVSGFANSAGGIVVWGVLAKPDDEGVDAAQKLRPIENVESAFSKLQSHTASAASPIVVGVESTLIPCNGDSGFMKTYVPQSDSGPHMAGLGEYRYYKRSGDSFRKLEHNDVADMFGRRPHPVLSLHWEPLLDPKKRTTMGILVTARAGRFGRGPSRRPGVPVS